MGGARLILPAGRRADGWRFTLFSCLVCCLSHCAGTPTTSSSGTVFVSNGTHILRVDQAGGQVDVVVGESSWRAVGVAVDVRQGLMFWTDIGTDGRGIYRAHLNGTGSQRIVADVGRSNGLSLDWTVLHVYWTDEERQTIEMCDYHGSKRKIVIHTGLRWPRGIVIDPGPGVLYWGDQGTRQIERSYLDGSDRHVVVGTDLVWPNQLGISHTTRRLYWVDAYTVTIESCDLDGGSRRRDRRLVETAYSAPIYGLAVVGNTAYISTWYDGAVYSVVLDLLLPAADSSPLTVLADHLTQGEIFSVAVANINTQPQTDSKCSPEASSGCSHICLVTAGATYKCACPTYGSLVLGPDGKTCQEPEEVLLYADKDKGQVGLLPPGGDVAGDDRLVLASSSMPVAVGYDPIKQQVYWSDVKERVIYTVNLNGGGRRQFLNESHGIGTVDGLYVDWLHRRLYFCNMGNLAPYDGGPLYTWHRIEFIGLDGQQRRTVVTDVNKPRAIYLDLTKGYMYYTDWGVRPRVMRADLNGQNPVEIRSPGNVSNPNGLVVYDRWLYLVDSNYNNRVGAAYLAVYDTHTGQWTTLDIGEVYIPFGLAAKEGQLFYTDWLSTETTTGAVFVYDVHSQNTSVLNKYMCNPTGLFYSPTRHSLPVSDDSCGEAHCSDICVPAPELSVEEARCMCSEDGGLVLGMDGRTCQESESFLLLTDLNTIKLVPLASPRDKHVYTLYHGHYTANYVAVTYDAITRDVYWSDLHSKGILVGNLDGRPVRVFHSSDKTIDGMALDGRGRHLYWTGYTRYTGVIAMASVNPGGAAYVELITGLDQPRAVVLDLDQRYMYWTEYGRVSGQPKVCRSFLDGSNNETILDTNLSWPNALAIAGGKLYVADGFQLKIEQLNMDGTSRHEVVQLSGQMEHIFGMAVTGRNVYYTDWSANTTVMADVITGDVMTLASNLYRPGALYFHRQGHSAGSDECSDHQHNCSFMCVSVPNGRRCTCPLGMQLASDARSCLDEHVWTVADWVRCPQKCHRFGHCAHLVSTSVYRCVCGDGFHGDGHTQCEACPVDTYKASLSNASCTTCPPGSGTIGWTGSTTCMCDDPNFDFSGGKCTFHVIEDVAENGSEIGETSRGCNVTPLLLRQPLYGRLECVVDASRGRLCRTLCDSVNFYLNPRPEYSAIYCLPTGVWQNNFPSDYVLKACLRKTSERMIVRRLFFWFTGPCNSKNNTLKRAIIGAMLAVLEQDGLCSRSYGGRDVCLSCDATFLDVTCRVGRRRRSSSRRRSADLLVLWTVRANSSIEKSLSTAEQRVNDRVAQLQARFDMGLTFQAGDGTYVSVWQSGSVAPLVLRCGHGAVNSSNICLVCPVGTYKSGDWCEDCPPGGYQDEEGQEDCKVCPGHGTTSPPGAFRQTQCYLSLNSPPATRNCVIIGAGGVVLALLAVLLAYLCRRHFRHHRHFTGKMCKTGPSESESPYVIEIRTNSHSDIAYEEIREEDPPKAIHREAQQQQQQEICTKDSILSKSLELAKVKNRSACSAETFDKLQPVMTSYSREEICLQVQSVLQAEAGGDETEAEVAHSEEDPETESSVALLEGTNQQEKNQA